MEHNRDKIEKKYGKSRCCDVQYYLNGLNRNYGFPSSEETLCEMIIDFNGFTSEDFSASFQKLDAMEFFGTIKRSHIRKACEDAKADRIREKQLKEPLPITVGCPMPDHIAKKLTDILPGKYGKHNG